MWFVELLFCLSVSAFISFLIWAIYNRNESYEFDEDANERYVDGYEWVAQLVLAIISSAVLFGISGWYFFKVFFAIAFGGIVCGPGITVLIFFTVTAITHNRRRHKVLFEADRQSQ